MSPEKLTVEVPDGYMPAVEEQLIRFATLHGLELDMDESQILMTTPEGKDIGPYNPKLVKVLVDPETKEEDIVITRKQILDFDETRGLPEKANMGTRTVNALWRSARSDMRYEKRPRKPYMFYSKGEVAGIRASHLSWLIDSIDQGRTHIQSLGPGGLRLLRDIQENLIVTQ